VTSVVVIVVDFNWKKFSFESRLSSSCFVFRVLEFRNLTFFLLFWASRSRFVSACACFSARPVPVVLQVAYRASVRCWFRSLGFLFTELGCRLVLVSGVV
jgi:hypothetical protein